MSAIAKKDSHGNQIPAAYIVILPVSRRRPTPPHAPCDEPTRQFLFTAGMTLIDSADSILMLYAYAGFPEHRFALLEDVPAPGTQSPAVQQLVDPEAPASPGTKTPPVLVAVGPAGASAPKTPSPAASLQELPRSPALSVAGVSLKAVTEDEDEDGVGNEERLRQIRVKRNAMSGLSIMLTLMSILVAFTYAPHLLREKLRANVRPSSISLIEIMGLIGDNCTPCQDAANDPNGGGLAGRWWRGWAAVSPALRLYVLQFSSADRVFCVGQRSIRLYRCGHRGLFRGDCGGLVRWTVRMAQVAKTKGRALKCILMGRIGGYA